MLLSGRSNLLGSGFILLGVTAALAADENYQGDAHEADNESNDTDGHKDVKKSLGLYLSRCKEILIGFDLTGFEITVAKFLALGDSFRAAF